MPIRQPNSGRQPGASACSSSGGAGVRGASSPDAVERHGRPRRRRSRGERRRLEVLDAQRVASRRTPPGPPRSAAPGRRPRWATSR